MRNPLLLLVAAATAAAALAVPAWSASSPPQITSFSVTAVHRSTSGLKVAVGGTIDCTAKAHFHVWVWVYESTRGALAHAYFPGKSRSRLSKKQIAKRLRLSSCTGAAKKWSVKAKAEGKHPATFAAGAAQVCTVVTVSHSRRYVLQSSCSNVTIG
jgi:hypothetical protein